MKLLCPLIPKFKSHLALLWGKITRWVQIDGLLMLASLGSAIILLVNIVGTVVLNTRARNSNIFHGNCSKASYIDSGLHAIINVLSTLLLAASNVCMQYLVSPTRKQVDEAHERGQYLDVGTQSLRNLWLVCWRRRALWIALAISSTPLQFLWNSSLAQTFPLSSPAVLVVTPDFLNGGTVDPKETVQTIDQRYIQAQVDYLVGEYPIRLDPVQCLSRYVTTTSNRSDVLMVSSYDIVTGSDTRRFSNNSLLFAYNPYGFDGPGNYWECGISNSFDCRKPKEWKANPSIAKDWNIFGYRIDYCLTKEIDLNNLCSIQFLLPIMIVVCVTNAAKCMCILNVTLMYFRQGEKPLVTIGDAICSFLQDPDLTTAQMCLVTKRELSELQTRHRSCDLYAIVRGPQSSTWVRPRVSEYHFSRNRWCQTASRCTWIFALLSFAVLTILMSTLLFVCLQRVQYNSGAMNSFLDYGFGSIRAQMQMRLGDLWKASYARATACYILFSNVPQFIASIIDFQSNALLTQMHVNQEWQGYGRKRKALRTSAPEGMQRGTYFLSLPWRYAVPQKTFLAVLHWTLSRSLFLVPIETYHSDGTFQLRYGTQGFSVWPMLSSLILCFLMLASLILLGFRRYDGGLPLNATCSAVISAACHQPKGERDAHLSPVLWGALSDNEIVLDSEVAELFPGIRDYCGEVGRTEVERQSVSVNSETQSISASEMNGEDIELDTADPQSSNETKRKLTIRHCCFSSAQNVGRPVDGMLCM
ncbi:uncharacterized protein PV09_04626 [Verruconis gallopava]|uniref:DUF6536 domain-containing protein n=1 Tax=Verruconis gallopava TaxID=253628 RepID=A0A0D1XP33_9PEZI|nr:uncharacterized protein PV09_04626 [Verruconis gallopava]KIW04336.1 hypothetical protein PV09_04626 [Verruconis gallopava]